MFWPRCRARRDQKGSRGEQQRHKTGQCWYWGSSLPYLQDSRVKEQTYAVWHQRAEERTEGENARFLLHFFIVVKYT